MTIDEAIQRYADNAEYERAHGNLEGYLEFKRLEKWLNACYNDLPPVTPTYTEIVTEFADRCRECGKTAITRAENDEILNEAWRLLMNVTEEDGVTPEEANGMLKLMNFFFYKYHGLKKKPEWAENVETRIEREKVDRTIRTISELLPRDKEEDQEEEDDANI